MKKYAAICATLAALAWVGVAAADTPQGKLTGSATLTGGQQFAITSPVIDGGTSYVGVENDLSGNCTGDSGTVTELGIARTVVCAHYVAASHCCNEGSPKMRFAVQIGFFYQIIRITDNGASTDTFAAGTTTTTSLADAQTWVNKGARGSNVGGWTFFPITSGDYTITASQT